MSLYTMTVMLRGALQAVTLQFTALERAMTAGRLAETVDPCEVADDFGRQFTFSAMDVLFVLVEDQERALEGHRVGTMSMRRSEAQSMKDASVDPTIQHAMRVAQASGQGGVIRA